MGITSAENGIQRSLDAMINRANTVSSYLNNNFFKKFQKAQIERWKSENQSQGSTWKPVDPGYAKIKRKKWAAYPGGGTVLMIAKGNLADAAQGRNSANYYKVVTNTSFTFGINLANLPYAKYPGVLRPFMQFSDDTINEWQKNIRDFITRNAGGL